MFPPVLDYMVSSNLLVSCKNLQNSFVLIIDEAEAEEVIL